jgi:hypothetical protein
MDQDDDWLRGWNAGIRATLKAGGAAGEADVVAAALAPADHEAYLAALGEERIARLTDGFGGAGSGP